MTDNHFERIGWAGFILIVSAYLLITVQLVDVSSTMCHLMNLGGALCMIVNARHKEALPLAWLNIIWFLMR
jgi:hypothetical protein